MALSLTPNERIVAFAAQFRARASVSELSTATGLRAHTVRYALDRLLERKILQPYSFIDIEGIGYTAYNLLCALSSHRQSVRLGFERALVQHQNVSSVYRIGGDYHYRILILAKSSRELLETTDRLVGASGDTVFDRSFVIRCGAWLFSRKYLHPKGRPAAPLEVASRSSSRALDPIDFQILQLVGQEGGWQLSGIASKLKVPISTVEYRIRKLQKDGVIKGWVYSVEAGAIGMFSYRLHVEMRQVDPATARALYSFCAKHLDVFSLTRCIGSWDYEIAIEVETQEQVTEIVQSLYESLSATVRSIRAIPIFSCLKSSMFPFGNQEATAGG